MASLRQTDFSAGEVDPLFWGRTDLPFFSKGARTLRNFFVSKHGAANSRPGTTFVAKTKYPDPPAPGPFFPLDYGKAVLIPFVASDSLSYVLEVNGEGSIRFYSSNATVMAGGVPYEVTGYTKADGTVAALPYQWYLLRRITYAQLGDSLVLCYPQAPAIELRRYGATDWRARELDLSRPLPQYCEVDTPANPTTTGWKFVSAVAGQQNPLAANSDHPKREWRWFVTALVQDPATGEKYETRAEEIFQTYDGADYDGSVQPVTNHTVNVYPDQPITLRRVAQAGTLEVQPAVTLHVMGYNLYRGRGDLYGFLGTTTSMEFIDLGAEPDYAHQPAQGSNPFNVMSALGPLARAENPLAVTHFQMRRAFGGTMDPDGVTERRMDSLFLSATNDFFDFDTHDIDVAGEALEVILANTMREGVRHLVTLNKLLVGTNSSWWSVNGGLGQPLDFDHIEAEVVDQVGTAYVRPVVVDKAVIFARTKGVGLRALLAEGTDGYKAVDVSQLAQHLFTGADRSVVDMAYAEDPWGILWVVRADGVLLSLTYTSQLTYAAQATFASEGMAAWTEHEMDGVVEAVCSVPETDEDGVYLLVKRTINGKEQRYIERMTSRHVRGGAVVDVLGNLTTPPDYICVDSALSYVGAATGLFAGLAHLEGKSVYVVAQDKPVMGPYPVVGGQVQPGFVVGTNVDTPLGAKLVAYIGLAYTCDLELLDVAGGEARIQPKQVTHVAFEVDRSRGLQVGQDFDHLTSVPEREVADGYGAGAFQTKTVKCAIKGKSDLSARACLRQAYPLPVTVIGFTRHLTSGESA